MSVSSKNIWGLESSHSLNFQPIHISLILWHPGIVSQGVFESIRTRSWVVSTCSVYDNSDPSNTVFFPSIYRVDPIYFLQIFCKNFVTTTYFIIREGPMRCHRCGGIMVYEKFYGPHEQFLGWRCIFCGEIVDEVILENRFAQRVG